MSDSITQNQPQTDKPHPRPPPRQLNFRNLQLVSATSEEQRPLEPGEISEPPVSATPDSGMPHQVEQVDQSRADMNAEEQQPSAPAGGAGELPVSEKLPIPKLKVSKIKLSGWRSRIVAAVVLGMVLGSGYFLFLHRGRLLSEGKKVVGFVMKKKAKDSSEKGEGTKTGDAKAVRQEKTTGENKIEQQKGVVEQPKKKEGTVAKQVDNTKYILEADKLFEQGEYERALPLYEKGMNKLMPFLNEENATYRLGECYLRGEKYEEALKMFQTINSDYVNSPYQFKSRLKTGECYAGLGEFRKARKVLYTILAQEGKCCSDEDKSIVVDSYFKIADYYMQEAERLRKPSVVGTSSVSQSLASK